MKITVYFEAPAGAHEIAVFYDEMLYMACVPALEARATAQGYVLSESVTYEEDFEKDEESYVFDASQEHMGFVAPRSLEIANAMNKIILERKLK